MSIFFRKNKEELYKDAYKETKKRVTAVDDLVHNLIEFDTNKSKEEKDIVRQGWKDGTADHYGGNKHYRGGVYKEEKNRPKYKLPGGDYRWVVQLAIAILVIAVIMAIVFTIVKQGIPLAVINLSIIALIWSFVTKGRKKPLQITSVFGIVLLLLAYNNTWFMGVVGNNISSSKTVLSVFFYTNLTAGLVAGYFLIRNIFNAKNTEADHREFSKRNLIIMGCLILVGGAIGFMQNYLNNTPIDNGVNNTTAQNIPPPPQVQQSTAVPLPNPRPTQTSNTAALQSPPQPNQPASSQAQEPAPPTETFLPIPTDKSLYPDQAEIIHDITGKQDPLGWTFSDTDHYAEFKILSAKIQDGFLVQNVRVAVPRHEGKYVFFFEVHYMFTKNERWKLTYLRNTFMPMVM